MNFELMLYNQANVRHPRLALELHHDDLSMTESAEAVDPSRSRSLDVSDVTVEEILALLPSP
jgi:hypothetical protein